MTFLFFLLGLGLLLGGGDLLVRGSSRLASALGLSPLIIGLTIVAYGTSAPELSVSVLSVLQGKADITLGNVIGSNIFNVLFILGMSALIAPLVVARRLIRWDVPIMIGISLALLPMAMNRVIERYEGGILVAALVLFTMFVIRSSQREPQNIQPELQKQSGAIDKGPLRIALHLLFILAGLGLLVLGTRWFVEGAVAFARSLGVSELVIGLTIIAAGTSMPEVFTSLIAAKRGEVDIAVGNVVGSNIFNLLGVLGFSALFSPHGVNVAPAALNFDIPVMIAVALACLPIVFTAHRIDRWEGGIFLFYYLAYAAFLVLDTRQHDALPIVSQLMLLFVIPMTVLTLAIGVYRHRRKIPSA